MFKAPNIKGPRFRKNFKRILTTETFKNFKKLHPQYTDITFNDFRKIIKVSSKKMWKTTIEERDGIELPTEGTLFVGSTKIKIKNNYDIQASIKANSPIKHRNFDTDGYVAKIYYSPYLSKMGGRDRSIWSFKGTRDYKRTVSTEYAKNWKKYIIVAELYTIVKNYKKHKKRHYYTESQKKAVQNYNEFDLN